MSKVCSETSFRINPLVSLSLTPRPIQPCNSRPALGPVLVTPTGFQTKLKPITDSDSAGGQQCPGTGRSSLEGKRRYTSL